MGSGDFGSNGSVHWNVRHTGPGAGQSSGKDPIPFTQIGNGGGHGGSFRVRMRFASVAAAQTALSNAQVNGQGVVTLLVPKEEPQRSQPGAPEIEVDW
jgi:hypothetical protein